MYIYIYIYHIYGDKIALATVPCYGPLFTQWSPSFLSVLRGGAPLF